MDANGFALSGAKATVARWGGMSLDTLKPAVEAQAKDGIFAPCPDNFFVGDTIHVEVSHREIMPVGFLAKRR